MMADKGHLQKQLANELTELRQRIDELEKKEVEYKREITALQENKKLYQSLFEDNPTAIVIVDSEARIVGFNQARTKLEGKLPKIGQIMYKEYAVKHITDMYAELMECIDSKISKEFFDQFYDNRFLHIKMSPVTGGAIITAIDITERKLAVEALKEREATLKSILMAAPVGTGLAHNKVFTWTSAQMNRMTGYTNGELVGKSARILYENDEEFERVGREKYLDIEKKGTGEVETRWVRKDSVVIDVLVRSTLLAPPDLNAGVTFTALDITARKRMEENLLRAKKLESISMIAGGIAHDYNNLLTSILGSISLLKLDLPHDDEILETLSVAEQASLQAKNLTQQLLTFSKGGAPTKTTLAMPELIKDATEFALRGSNVKAEYLFPDDLWPVKGDKGQLAQVFHSLSINADQAMPEGGVITVHASNIHANAHDINTLQEGNYVKIIFRDQGAGIPKENLPNIFDPFFSTKPDKSGMGLSIVYGIIKNHGGTISTESSTEKGTTFFLYLPAATEQIAAGRTEDTGETIRGKERILVMDDEETVRVIIKRMLHRLGYEVELTRDGREAIECFKKAEESGKPFDALIMDLTIPGGMGGKEALAEILAINPHVKAIVSS